jgi:hypothetical protein
LLIFLFHPGEMAALIGLGAIAMALLGLPDDVITTGITTVVVMCVAAISPDHAWRQPILRVVDAVVGVAVGVGGARLTEAEIQDLTATRPRVVEVTVIDLLKLPGEDVDHRLHD